MTRWMPLGCWRCWLTLFTGLLLLQTALVEAEEIRQQAIQLHRPGPGQVCVEPILRDEIAEVDTRHVACAGPVCFTEAADADHALILLALSGQARLAYQGTDYLVAAETIAVPLTLEKVEVHVAAGQELHCLVLRKAYSDQDRLDLASYANRQGGGLYLKRFSDCPAYQEAIKSPKTVSRTVLPNEWIPRVAMGTVETTGPDEVGAHSHPMLDQLFLGLADNDVTVIADGTPARFQAHTLLHIPLGSQHGVTVTADKRLYYMWMDFFRTKEGEEWLKTHKPVTK